MKGAFIVEYIGELVTAQQADRREKLDSSVFLVQEQEVLVSMHRICHV